MTYRWGFDLDMAAIRLMRREAGQWHEIAIEKIDGPDIEDRLRAMVERVEDGQPVDLFLPRDQILYTDVPVSSEDSALDEIEKAMDGRTPYPLDDLEIDWEMVAPDTARVAAIARETLDEAAAFAEVRGLSVSGFSSLADKSDFPRLPDFGGEGLFDDEDDSDSVEAAVAAAMQFASKRETSRPNGPIATLTPSKEGGAEPVLRVDDPTPVMRVTSRDVAPLDPGAPMEAPRVEPRVRTDIAAAAVSRQVASLTPPEALQIKQNGTGQMRTAAVFVIALLLTVGIAAVVWKILPFGPPQSAEVEAVEQIPQTQFGLAKPEPRPEGLAISPPEVETAQTPVEPVTTDPVTPLEVEEAAAPEPELPQPAVLAETGLISPPVAGSTPVFAALTAAPTFDAPPKLLKALRSGEGVPAHDPKPPVEPTPRALAVALVMDPAQGVAPDAVPSGGFENLEIAPYEAASLSFDPVALPAISAFDVDALPQVAPAPEISAPQVAALPSVPEVITPEQERDVAEEGDQLSATDLATQLALETLDEGTTTAETSLPSPTEFAAAIQKRAPRLRPSGFTEDIERQKFNGRTRAELASVRPSHRPESVQVAAARASEPAPVSELAVETSLAPPGRPNGFDQIVAAALVQREADRLTASLDYQTPDTSAAIEAALEADAEPETRPQDTPRLVIPSNASVARQATIDNAIRLNKVNLVGVYGTPADRRALVRLPSGRYVKVKVGDRVDGGTVAQISDNELIYRKGSRTLSLSLPRG